MGEESELKANISEFISGAEAETGLKRWNSAVVLYFKALAAYGTLLVWRKYKVLPKNHEERFSYLNMVDTALVARMKKVFSVYRKSYDLRIGEGEAKRVGKEVREIVSGTEDA